MCTTFKEHFNLQLENLGLLAAPFGQALHTLALTWKDLHSLRSQSKLEKSSQDYHHLAYKPCQCKLSDQSLL